MPGYSLISSQKYPSIEAAENICLIGRIWIQYLWPVVADAVQRVIFILDKYCIPI